MKHIVTKIKAIPCYYARSLGKDVCVRAMKIPFSVFTQTRGSITRRRESRQDRLNRKTPRNKQAVAGRQRESTR